jgi:hypothetical protein
MNIKHNDMKTLPFMNILARTTMLLLLAVLTSATTWADNNLSYFDPTAAVGNQTKTATNPTAITSTTTELGTANTETWYYVSGPVTNSNRITVNGTVNIILVDGCNFTASKGIRLLPGKTLNIYAQKAGNGCGALTANKDNGSHNGHDAAIGGDGGSNGSNGDSMDGDDGGRGYDGGAGEGAGTLNIYGGNITVNGNVGGGDGGKGGNGGNSNVLSDGEGSVCGSGGDGGDGGSGGDGGTISFYGGIVYVKGNVGRGNGGNGGNGGWSDWNGRANHGPFGDGGNNGTTTLRWTSVTDEFNAHCYNDGVTLENDFVNKDNENQEFEANNNYSSSLNGITLVPAGTKYDVTLGGSYAPACLVASKEKAREGATITLTAVNGYSVSSITVTDANNQAVSLTDNHDGTWTFLMPASAVTVTPTAQRIGYSINAPSDFGITAANDDVFAQYNADYYKEGATITISVDLADGCEVANFSITSGTDNTPVAYTQNGTTWTFTMPAADVTVSGDVGYPAQYIAADGTTQTAYATVIDGETGDLSVGWYLAKGNVTISDRREIDGTVNLILADGCALSYEKGIRLSDGNTLNIYAQSTGNGCGKLMASHYNVDAAIGGDKGANSDEYGEDGKDAGTLNIYGGQIIVDGNIGGGDGGYGSSCTVGDDDFRDGHGGNGGNGGTISIFGGIVHVSGTIGGGNGGQGDVEDGSAGSGTINLSWTNTTDEIYAKVYRGTVTLANVFTDGLGTNFAAGECTDNSTINDKMLYPEGIELHTVTLPDGDPACLETSKEKAKAGATITLTAVNGYSVSNVMVTYGNNQAVSVTDNQDGTWTFTMPTSNVTVSATATLCHTINAPGFFVITTANQGDSFVQKGKTYFKPQATVTVTLDENFTNPENFSINNGNINYEGTCPWTFTMPAADVTISGNATPNTNDLLLLAGTAAFTVTAGTKYSEYDEEQEGCRKLLDGMYEDDEFYTKWCVNPACYVEFNTSEPVVPKAYILTTGNDNANWSGRNPKDWTIQAKLNPDDTWMTIASVTGDETMEDKNFTDYTFTFSNAANNAYRYFRFNITATRDANFMQLSEMRMWVKGKTLTANEAPDGNYWTTFYCATRATRSTTRRTPAHTPPP